MTWSLHDPITAETYVLPIGPSKVETLDRQHVPLLSDNVQGGPAVFLTQLTPPPLSFTGSLIAQSEYLALRAWAMKDYPVQVVDDLGRTTNVLITDWTPVRVRNASTPWFHTWTLKVLVLDATA